MKPPDHLVPSTQRWFEQVLREYALEEHHVRILLLAAEAWDRSQEARQILSRDGITYVDRFGAPRKHPCVSIEEAARVQFARLMRELDLDGAPEPDLRLPRRAGAR